MFRLTIVIPCFNEASRLPQTLAQIATWVAAESNAVARLSWLFVNDGSTDETLSILKTTLSSIPHADLLTYPKNRGKGAACRAGFLQAYTSADAVLYMDADLATPLKHIADILTLFQTERPHLIVGNRFHPASKVQRSFRRRLLAWAFNRWACRLLDLPFRDTQCGFKAFRFDTIETLFLPLQTHGFAFDLELLVRASKAGLIITDIPIEWSEMPGSSIRIPRDLIRMARGVLKIHKLLHDLAKELTGS